MAVTITEVRIHEFTIVTVDTSLADLVDNPEEREVCVSIDLNEIESIYQTWGEESDDRARIGMKSGQEFTVLCTYKEAVHLWKYAK